jgi:hypothetical protein
MRRGSTDCHHDDGLERSGIVREFRRLLAGPLLLLSAGGEETNGNPNDAGAVEAPRRHDSPNSCRKKLVRRLDGSDGRRIRDTSSIDRKLYDYAALDSIDAQAFGVSRRRIPGKWTRRRTRCLASSARA